MTHQQQPEKKIQISNQISYAIFHDSRLSFFSTNYQSLPLRMPGINTHTHTPDII